MNRPICRAALAALLLVGGFELRAETIHLANGDALDGTVVERTAEHVVIEHESLGRIRVPAEGVLPKRRDTGILGSGLLQGWRRSAQLGVNGAEGNSQNVSGLVGFDLRRDDEVRRWSIDGRYTYASDGGSKSTNEGFLQTTHDWKLEDRPWFPFVDGRYDFDEFQDWDHRLSAHTGLGRTLLDGEGPLEILGRIGPGVSRTFGSEDDRTVPELLAGLQGTWTISERQRLTFYTKFFADLDEVGEYRNLSGAAWVVDVDPRRGISLKLGLDNRYESRVTDDADRDDLTYYGSLLLGF